MFCDNGKMKQDMGLINCKVCKGSGIYLCCHMHKTNYIDCIFLPEYFGCISFPLPLLTNCLILVRENQYIVFPQGKNKRLYSFFPCSTMAYSLSSLFFLFMHVFPLYRIDFLQEMWRFWLFPSAMSCEVKFLLYIKTICFKICKIL